MENKVQIFENSEFGKIRVIEEDGKFLFVASDAAKMLGYVRPADAISSHCKGSVKRRLLTNGGMQEMKVIPEGDLYRLVAHSELPSAEKFESWIFDDVLPTIRKTGSYSTRKLSQLEIVAMNAQALVEQEHRMNALEGELNDMREVITLNPNGWRHDANSLIIKVAHKLGGNDFIKTVREEIYTALQERFGVSLKRRLDNMRQRAAVEGVPKTKRDNMNYLDVMSNDKKLIEGYISIVKEVCIKHGVTVSKELSSVEGGLTE